jgi:hypothetical protein
MPEGPKLVDRRLGPEREFSAHRRVCGGNRLREFSPVS